MFDRYISQPDMSAPELPPGFRVAQAVGITGSLWLSGQPYISLILLQRQETDR